jgi:hypothetical protein
LCFFLTKNLVIYGNSVILGCAIFFFACFVAGFVFLSPDDEGERGYSRNEKNRRLCAARRHVLSETAV